MTIRLNQKISFTTGCISMPYLKIKNLPNNYFCYDSFSDIEFNPQKSINCQAKAAAAFVGLSTQHLLSEALLSCENF